jgi:hypothetical protein
VTSVALAFTVTGCGQSEADKYAAELEGHGYGKVNVTQDSKKVKGKKTLQAYDADIKVNTDNDPATCDVELEKKVTKKGKLTGAYYVDEVNGQDVSGWGGGSPNLTALQEALRTHGYDC